MNKKYIVIFLTFCFVCSYALQDTSRYFVFFKDKNKEGTDYPYTISNPMEFLTKKAIDRRAKQNIRIDESDLPVNPMYVSILQDMGIEVFFTSRWMNGALIQTDEANESLIKLVEFVDSLVLIAKGKRLKKNQEIRAGTPTEFDPPLFNEATSDIQLTMLGADRMHSNNIKGQGMLIALLDNGYKGVNRYSPFQHLWENERIIATRDFVENMENVYQYGNHGTAVLSAIAGQYVTSTTDFYGVAYEADYILCITEDNQAENILEEYNWLLGAEYADSLGVDVINGSLGYLLFDIAEHNYTYENLDGKTTIVSKAAEMAAKKGIIVVVSAGNEGSGSWRHIISPADANGILTVGSVDDEYNKSLFSSIGPTADGRIKPDVAAFGEATAALLSGGAIRRLAGTSLSSPLIAGFAAGIWQENPDWTSQEVITAIKNLGHRANNPDILVGHGVPNYNNLTGRKILNIRDIIENKVTIYPNPFDGSILHLIIKEPFKTKMSIRIIDPKGLTIYNKSFRSHQIKQNMELPIDVDQKGVYFLYLKIRNKQKVVKLIRF